MDDHERYLFDLNGYITVPDALDAGQVARVNELIDRHIAEHDDPAAPQLAFSSVHAWRGAMTPLIDNERILPYLDALFSPPPFAGPERGPFFRLDHTYSMVLRPQAHDVGAFVLHGGGTPFDPGQFYRVSEGRLYNGLVVVAYNLADVGEDDGGFGCVPGSHKSNFRLPSDWSDLRRPNPIARAVTGRAGSAVIFTEALTHGTLPWRGSHERRTVFFKYDAYCTAFSGSYPGQATADWPELSERQRAILEPPNSRNAVRPWRREAQPA